MIITFHGGQLVRFQTGDSIIASNPSSAPAGSKSSKFGADIVLCSSFDRNHHSVDNVTYNDKEPFVIDGPGSYEYNDVLFTGEHIGKNPTSDIRHLSTFYRFIMDDITVCVFGAVIPKDELNPDASELISEPDVLVLPIDAESLSNAISLLNFIDPKIIIPVGHWGVSEVALQKFCSELGAKPNPESKLTLKRKDVEQYSKHVAILTP